VRIYLGREGAHVSGNAVLTSSSDRPLVGLSGRARERAHCGGGRRPVSASASTAAGNVAANPTLALQMLCFTETASHTSVRAT
jgi:hypothetical protein